MPEETAPKAALNEDEKTLARMGYKQELARRMGGFSNFAISFSIICILAGCLTSFHVGFMAVGGAAIGIGWPVACLFSLAVAMTMGQVASAFPTAGGLYHWASILGGKGWGWSTAWFNLAGLITVLAAINAGTYDFFISSFGIETAQDATKIKLIGLTIITLSQAYLNHRGIRLTTLLTDFSGYWILGFSVVLTALLFAYAPSFHFDRIFTFTNNSGLPADSAIYPKTSSIAWLFALSLLLPAYTITGFDASAHTSEETRDAAHHVPRGIVRSVLVSAIFGWVLLISIVIAIPDMTEAAKQGDQVFNWTLTSVLPKPLRNLLLGGIVVAQYLCGLATLTSASRMLFAFARDGGLPCSGLLRRVNPANQTPSVAIWVAGVGAVLFTLFISYATIAAISTVFLYISYCLPIALGFWSHGKGWTQMGPWQLGVWYKPLAVVSVVGCLFLLFIGVQPPNEIALKVVVGLLLAQAVVWWGWERRRFKGPPEIKC